MYPSLLTLHTELLINQTVCVCVSLALKHVCEAAGSRTLFLVEDVEQNDADFVVRLNICIQQDRNDVLHGVFKRLALCVGAHGQILHGNDLQFSITSCMYSTVQYIMLSGEEKKGPSTKICQNHTKV